MTIAQNLEAVREQVAVLAPGRQVAIVAVSKGQSAERMREAWQAGQVLFGESYVQEAMAKQEALRDLPLEWHFIGPLQSNKTTVVALNFHWVHGVDRIKTAERLSSARRGAGREPLNVCLQVNLSGESSKSGVLPEDVALLARQVVHLPGLCLRGLMTLPELTTDLEQQKFRFRALRQLLEALNRQGLALDTLSMGMSGDFPSAVAEGSTIVRIGTAIFGERHRKS